MPIAINQSSGSSQRRTRAYIGSGGNVVSSELERLAENNPGFVVQSADGSTSEIEVYETHVPITVNLVSRPDDIRIGRLNIEEELTVDFGGQADPLTQVITFYLSDETNERIILTGVNISPCPAYNFLQSPDKNNMYEVSIVDGNQIVLVINPKIINMPSESWSDGDGSQVGIIPNQVLIIEITARAGNAVTYKGKTAIFKED